MALLELFAFVGELLSSHSDRIAAESFLGSGRRDEVEVEVAGQPWQRVTDFADSGAQDRHYLVSQRADGASVVEFGDGVHGRRPPSDDSIGVRYRQAGAYSSVLLEQGRVILDTDVSEQPVRATCGVYRATVLDTADPLVQQRLLVRIPDLSGDEAVWAAACLPVPGSQEVPAVGTGVWVALEAGDASRPIWLGSALVQG